MVFYMLCRLDGACVDSKSEAIRENQIGAVLLHRIDEELLHRILLHSNTSLSCGPVKTGNESLTYETCKTWLAASP